MNEVWKQIPGFEIYEISNHGRVRRVKEGEIIITEFRLNEYGYPVRSIRHTETRKVTTVKLHRWVAKLFVPNPNNHKTVNHIDGDKLNNRADNLEWVSLQDNIQHAIDNNLRKRSHRQVLTENEVREIRKLYNTTNLTQKELGKLYNVNQMSIYSLVRYNSWFNIDPHLKEEYEYMKYYGHDLINWKKTLPPYNGKS